MNASELHLPITAGMRTHLNHSLLGAPPGVSLDIVPLLRGIIHSDRRRYTYTVEHIVHSSRNKLRGETVHFPVNKIPDDFTIQ